MTDGMQVNVHAVELSVRSASMPLFPDKVLLAPLDRRPEGPQSLSGRGDEGTSMSLGNRTPAFQPSASH
jgi:hypothetical protein